MMRRLVERHRGILPLDTVESIWRVIISTFTYVQAPFSVHADVSLGESAMRDSARFHFGFTVPYVSHFSAPAAVEAVAKSKGDLALVSGHLEPHAVVDRARGRGRAEDHRAAAVRRARRPSGRAAGVRGLARRRQRHGDRGRDVERAGVRLERRDRARAVAAGRDRRGAGYRLRRRGAAGVDCRLEQPRKDQGCPDRGRRLGALIGSRRQPCNALYGAPERGAKIARTAAARQSGVEDVPPRAESRHSRYCALHARQEPGAGAGPQGVQAVGQRDAVRPLAEGDRGLQGSAADHLEDYPEGTSRVLREAIGRAFGLDPDRIICGAGSDEILNLLAHTYLSHGDEAISTTHGFLVYPIATMANGAINVVAPETNFTADVDAILQRVSPRTKLVWLANPNNPTGTYLPFDEVKRLRAGLPPHVLLVLDAAYSDYVVAQRLRDRHRAGGDHREHGDDPHLLEDPRPRRACGSAGCSARPISSMRSTAFAGRSTSRRRRCWRRSRRSRTPRISRCRRRTPRSGATG